MLRRFAASSSASAAVAAPLRTTTTTTTTMAAAAASAGASALTQAARTVVVFTEQSEVLQNNSKHLKYGSRVWVEQEDEWWTSKLSELKPDARPTEVKIDRLIEYYNIDCLSKASREAVDAELEEAKCAPQPGQHYSLRTKAPFVNKQVLKQLDTAVQTHGYTGQYWLSAKGVSRGNTLRAKTGKPTLTLRPGARKTGVVFHNFPTWMFNAEQFVNPKAIQQHPISGYKRSPYGGSFSEALAADVAANKYECGVYFTQAQLELYGLASSIAPGASPVEVPLSDSAIGSGRNAGGLVFYNIEEVADADKLCEAMQRFPTEKHTQLVSGTPYKHAKTLAAMDAAGFGSKLWVTKKELEDRGFELKPTAKGVKFLAGDSDASASGAGAGAGASAVKAPASAVLLYNVQQLVPDARPVAFKKAGVVAMP